jgi:hypothetical protein
VRNLCVLALLAGCASARAWTQAQFTATAAERLHARHPTWNVAPIGPLRLIVAEPDGTTTELPLDAEWPRCRDEASCEAVVAELIARVGPGGIVAPASQPAPDTRISAVVRLRTEGDFLSRPIAGDLVAVYQVGTPPGARFARRRDLASLGLDEAALDRAARETIAASLDPLPPDPPTTIAVLARGNDLEASRLLLVDQWVTLASKMTGPLYACAPGADTLLYADGANPSALPALRQLANDLHRRVLTPLPPLVLRFTGDGWEIVP